MTHFLPRPTAVAWALLTWFAAPAQTLQVTWLGTGAPIPRFDRFGPSVLAQAGPATLLFGCGRGAAHVTVTHVH
ncbi:hypothetical protein SAMN00120144_3700 [Hymenobacter roseosalivarius DSM 11622]|uniref:Uncharacterized protein n=1 Tax=Hymenobacter roseosalivarius DSM 11622 TaxID=645990 RepID=A0A1W1W3F0_9BACT|nr:hypothetical protein [Hymenobacter roseosalivarius]SMB99614.1 hypothetical protein SAMN00120144_3700 [Hymenobacter roseosalivarius DSM 11622]